MKYDIERAIMFNIALTKGVREIISNTSETALRGYLSLPLKERKKIAENLGRNMMLSARYGDRTRKIQTHNLKRSLVDHFTKLVPENPKRPLSIKSKLKALFFGK